MKQSRFQWKFRKGASALHKAVGNALREEPFELHKVLQEYPVDKVNVTYSNSRHHFDWVVLDLKLVVECHGKQHYEPVELFLREGLSFKERQRIDLQKQEAATEAGFTYVVVPYFDQKKVTPEWLWDLYLTHFNDMAAEKPVKKPESVYKQKMKERAREHRKAQYQRLKALKREVSNGV